MANPQNPNTGNKNVNQGGQGQGQGMPRREQDDQGRTPQRNPGQQRDIEGEIPGNRNSELDDRNEDVTERRPHREQR